MASIDSRFMMPDAQISAEYFDWLVSMIAIDPPEYFCYNNLMNFLYQEDFTWTMHRDANRAQDGTDLRDLFSYETGIIDWHNALGGPCTVLEMLVGLAHRIDNEVMYDYELGDRTNVWFWEMIGNIDLDELDDNHFRQDKAEKLLNNWLYRQFDSNGNGSIFPLKSTQNDQRMTEIWLQAQEYFVEKYGI